MVKRTFLDVDIANTIQLTSANSINLPPQLKPLWTKRKRPLNCFLCGIKSLSFKSQLMDGKDNEKLGRNKKFLETDYPLGRAIEVPACRLAGFASFILTEEAKN